MPNNKFDARKAFSRNIGWLSETEQEELSKIRVGILGVGGVGGQYAEILSRLGVRRFVIWDPDEFSIENTNRQNECRISNYAKSKAETITKLILDINPSAEVQFTPRAILETDLEDFCRSIDFYFDGLDFFATEIRIKVFRELRRLGIPAVTVAPVGTGASCLVFDSHSMSFDDYFGLHTTTDHVERSILFLTGLTPTLMQRTYLAAPQLTNLAQQRVPSLGIGVTTAGSMAVSTFLKITLKRGKVHKAPWSIHFDPFLGKFKKRYTFWGYRNPLQFFKRKLAHLTLRTQAR